MPGQPLRRRRALAGLVALAVFWLGMGAAAASAAAASAAKVDDAIDQATATAVVPTGTTRSSGLVVAAGGAAAVDAQPAPADPAPAGVADQLRQWLSNPRAAALAPGLYLQSTVAALHAQGQALARLPMALPQARAALRSPEAWCLLLLLHPNVWRCEVAESGQGQTTLQILMGQQRVAVIGSTHTLNLAWKVTRDDESGLSLELMAEQGPLGTRDYRIGARLEALDETHSALALRFSNAFTRSGLWLAELYVNTAGRHRIGFTVESVDANGQAVYVRGLRGSVERNTMRFHLAVQSWLSVQSLPAARRVPRAIEAWFDASEQYAAQLHEIERQEYVQMKLQQYGQHVKAVGPGAKVRHDPGVSGERPLAEQMVAAACSHAGVVDEGLGSSRPQGLRSSPGASLH
ncbi:MAG: hypothetical protein ACO305_15460 [Rubrivivax sp.]